MRNDTLLLFTVTGEFAVVIDSLYFFENAGWLSCLLDDQR